MKYLFSQRGSYEAVARVCSCEFQLSLGYYHVIGLSKFIPVGIEVINRQGLEMKIIILEDHYFVIKNSADKSGLLFFSHFYEPSSALLFLTTAREYQRGKVNWETGKIAKVDKDKHQRFRK